MRAALVFSCVLLALPAVAGFRVSNFRKVGKSAEYDAQSAIDDNPKTAWQIDPESDQKGEWIEIDLPKGEVDKIAVMVGWEKDEESWKDYGRIKAGRLEVYTDSADGQKRLLEKNVVFEDQKGLQIIDVDDTKVGSELYGGKARLVITEFTAGDDYPNVAMAEFRILLKEFDAQATFATGGEPKAAEGAPESLIDNNVKTVFVGDASETPVAFTIEAQGAGVSSLVVTPGAKTHARPKTLEVTCADQTRTYELKDEAKPQSFALPSIVGYTGSAWGKVQVTVKETYPGTKPGVAIADVALKATNFDGF